MPVLCGFCVAHFYLLHGEIVERLIYLRFGSWFKGSNKGQNDISYAMDEELEGRLRVDPYADPLYIYKRSVV